jgi:hypothetical protein
MALSRVLKKYDLENDTILLESLSKNTIFALNNKKFKKGDLRRSRYVCIEIASGKQFLVHALANVRLISE